MPKPGSDVGILFLHYSRLERKRLSDGLTVQELERWTALKRKLNQNFSPGLKSTQADQRQSVRVPAALHCSFETIGHFDNAFITNLSSGGVFINTVSPLPIGSRLQLRIRIDESGADIEVPGVVVSNNVGPGLSQDKRGMGIRFSDLAPQVLEQINSLYTKAVESHCGAEDSDDTAQPSRPKKSKPRGR